MTEEFLKLCESRSQHAANEERIFSYTTCYTLNILIQNTWIDLKIRNNKDNQ